MYMHVCMCVFDQIYVRHRADDTFTSLDSSVFYRGGG